MPQPLPLPLRLTRYLLVFVFILLAIEVIVVIGSIVGGGPTFDTYGMTLDTNNNVFIADGSAHKIQKYNSNGDKLTSIGKKGYEDGQFGDYNSPRDVVVSRQGNIYAIDYDNSRIEKFDQNGHFLTLWNLGKDATGRRTDILKIAVDSREQIYLAIPGEGVKKYDSNGNFLGQIGADLPKKDELNEPWDLAVDDNDNLFVAQPLEVYRFDASGKFITKWPIKTFDHITDDDINSLQNIGLDHQGNVYINDENIIEKFDYAGNFLLSWNIKTGSKYIWEIAGIDADSENKVYILNRDENQVEIFDGQGHALNQLSIGWPKWLQFNQPYFFVLEFSISFLLILSTFGESHFRKRYGLPKASPNFGTYKDYLIAGTTTGRLAQILIIAGSILGIILSYLSFIVAYNIGGDLHLPNLLGLAGLSIGQATLAAFTIFLNASLAYSALLVPKKPFLAGILQLAGVMLLLGLSAIDPLKLGLNILPVLVGGILALRTARKNIHRLRPGPTNP